MISVIIPAVNEAATIASVVALAHRSRLVDEVIVVDDGSIDGTPELAREAGARVITSTFLGKGTSMEDGLGATRNELLVYLEGDLSGLSEDLVDRLAQPLLDDSADFVKAKFSLDAGRVTTLAARPLLVTFFPEVARLSQPLGGIIAARRSLLRRLRFETDYGVDVALVIDALESGARLVEVDVGHIEHDSQSLEILGYTATQVVRVILDRAWKLDRMRLGQIREVEEVERRAQAEISIVARNLGQAEHIALLDMDGVLLDGRFVVALAERVSASGELAQFLDNRALDDLTRTKRTAALFTGVRKETFEEIARSIPLMPGAVDAVVALRKAGYRVGIVTDSFLLVAEVVRRRVFADFSVAHLVRFRRGAATGDVEMSPAMVHPKGCAEHTYCKLNVMLHLCERLDISADRVLAVGDDENDICLLKAAGRSIAYRPKSAAVEEAADLVVHGSLDELPRVLLDHSTPE